MHFPGYRQNSGIVGVVELSPANCCLGLDLALEFTATILCVCGEDFQPASYIYLVKYDESVAVI